MSEQTDKEQPGKFTRFLQRNFDMFPPVFVPSAILILSFIGFTLAYGKEVEGFFAAFQSFAYSNLGWMMILAVNISFIGAIYLALGKFGDIRIGGKNAKPEFSKGAWLAMLFSAGMGIGLVYFGTAEPLIHFRQPPYPIDGEAGRAAMAFQMSYMHYGFYPWSVYAIVGLAMAYFTFNKNLPLSIRSVFYPLLGDRIYGPIGHVIDVIAVMATLFGLATTLGLGVQQINSGITHLTGLENSTNVQIVLIGIITLFATISVVTGLKKGIKVLSQINIYVALFFLILVFAIGPSVRILDVFVQSTGEHLQTMLSIGTWTEAFRPDSHWQNDWTVFYWAWWIAWSPFVGIFIARISKGRTVREFLVSVLTIPVLFTFFWFAVFGSSALELELTGNPVVGDAAQSNFSTALFVMLEQYPLGLYTCLLAIFLVTGFFVTSSDSGSLVVDMLTSGGKLDAPVGQRIFWALIEGLVAAGLLVGGGLKAMQAMSIAAGIPYALLIVLMLFSLHKAFKQEVSEKHDTGDDAQDT